VLIRIIFIVRYKSICVCLDPVSSSGRLIYSVSSPPYILGKSPFEKLLPIASENQVSRKDVGVTDMSDRIRLNPIRQLNAPNPVGDPGILILPIPGQYRLT